MIKNKLKDKISGIYPDLKFDILIPPNAGMGDYSTNLAFMLAKHDKISPDEASKKLSDKLSKESELKKYFKKIEPAGTGFVNFHLSDEYLRESLVNILNKKSDYGSGENKKHSINLEFVSANPTGPLTVANVRAAPYGDALANILKKVGYEVTKEYYVNDAGNQVRLLGESVARRYIRLKGKTIDFPDNLYQGEYIIDIAKEIEKENLAGDIEFDKLVELCTEYSIKKLSASIKKSLADLGVEFDVWFSERELHTKGEVESTLKILEKGKHVYDKEGARWLKFSSEGAVPPSDVARDTPSSLLAPASPQKEEVAVLIKSDGNPSYLMTDIAYTRNKFIRGFNEVINIWGTDHHGDVPRLKAGVAALNYDNKELKILLHQLVSIKSGGESQRMSKRKGEFVLADELLGEVGKDAIRFNFLTKDLNTHVEFDVDLAKEESKNNPVYYIQYAYARLNSIFNKLKVKSLKFKVNKEDLEYLKEPEELNLIRRMVKFPELINDIGQSYQVHHLSQYAFDLAGAFHNFYEKHRVVQPASSARLAEAQAERAGGDDKNIEKARLALCLALENVLEISLNLLGLSTPKRMDNKEG